MAWHYARFVNRVAEEGKEEYALPMYLNAQLPSPFERSGEYPSGGSHPYYQDVYRAGAPAIDFYAPDIYWPNFEYWVQRYQRAGNPVFIPEARIEASPITLFTHTARHEHSDFRRSAWTRQARPKRSRTSVTSMIC
jgi:hypothetical protein